MRSLNLTKTFILCLSLILSVDIFVLFAASPEEDYPEEIIINQIEDEYTGVNFDHSTHNMLAEDCGTCHHHAGSNETLGCLKCHSIEPSVFKKSAEVRFIPCRDCHKGLNPDNPAMPSLKVAYHRQCFTCHKGMEGIAETPAGCIELCHKRK